LSVIFGNTCFAYSAAASKKKNHTLSPYHVFCVAQFIKAFEVDFILPTTDFCWAWWCLIRRFVSEVWRL